MKHFMELAMNFDGKVEYKNLRVLGDTLRKVKRREIEFVSYREK